MKAASFEMVVRALNDADVPFIVVGGIAVNAHGYGRLTHDIDLVVRLAPDVVRATFGALASLGYRPLVPISADQFADPLLRARWIAEKGMQVLNFHSEAHAATRVDLFVQEPFDFDAEYRQALLEHPAPDLPVRIVRLETLIRMKERAGRLIDQADIAELRLLHGDEPGGNAYG